ncbi:hypothetical protein SGLAD_v1c03030 [Spiroplasma gladiatoris]|uniref:Uncharacterized protein n=1 Tax=Spiroplasma gladiatoris TaxID=2143 RepID=A0A4P7AH54_9MOLU|nr:hypothetical protein [Spiroplasma gladiatoris]QBQ07502.1 hypothetical protein SGLAD_v1c03030 [Spiroplasma gladiatoris]
MAELSRMERNKKLHIQIRNEIVYKKQQQDEKSLIYSTFERLKLIDLNFFKEKLDEFDKNHQMEKPFLDKDKSNSLISEEIRFEIKQEIANLKKIKQTVNKKPLVNINDYEEFQVKSPKYLSYCEGLKQNENIFMLNIDKFKEKQRNLKDPAHDISMSTVQQVRNADTRPTLQMIRSVEERLEIGQKRVNKAWVTYSKKRRFKKIIWAFVVFFLLMIIVLIIPFFV